MAENRVVTWMDEPSASRIFVAVGDWPISDIHDIRMSTTVLGDHRATVERILTQSLHKIMLNLL
jgi:hypothetical protein